MHIVELDVFAAARGALAWPWIALDPTHTRLAFVASARKIETRVLVADARLPKVAPGPSFALPDDLALPATDAEHGLRGSGAESSFVVTLGAAG